MTRRSSGKAPQTVDLRKWNPSGFPDGRDCGFTVKIQENGKKKAAKEPRKGVFCLKSSVFETSRVLQELAQRGEKIFSHTGPSGFPDGLFFPVRAW